MVLTPGTVLYLWFPMVRPYPKEKFAILGAIEPAPMLLFIDSDVNPFVNHTEELVRHHLQIAQATHPFLAYDSWVDCTYPVGYDLEGLKYAVHHNPEIVKAAISDDLRSLICDCVSTSKLWPPAKKQRFVAALSARTPFEF